MPAVKLSASIIIFLSVSELLWYMLTVNWDNINCCLLFSLPKFKIFIHVAITISKHATRYNLIALTVLKESYIYIGWCSLDHNANGPLCIFMYNLRVSQFSYMCLLLRTHNWIDLMKPPIFVLSPCHIFHSFIPTRISNLYSHSVMLLLCKLTLNKSIFYNLCSIQVCNTVS